MNHAITLTTPTVRWLLAALLVPLGIGTAQDTALDETAVAAVWHQVSGTPLDLERVAAQSDVVRRASNFDKPDATAAEVQRLRRMLDDLDVSRQFTVRVNDHISEYDHAAGEFSVRLFEPGYFVPLDAFGEQYQLVFANADRARAIAMPKDQARDFDVRLNRAWRAVTTEVRFRVIGAGDPAGAVTGQRVVRAELLAVRVLDATGSVLHEPDLSAPTSVAESSTPAFEIGAASVSGFSVGVPAADLQATLERLFGPVTRRDAGSKAYPGFTGALVVNEMGCVSYPGKRTKVKPGDVCVTAFTDANDVVRSIRVERVFAWFDAEVFRRTLTGYYGAVTGARAGADYALGWGPEIDASLVYDRSGPHTALAAYYTANDDWMTRGLNSLPQIRVILQLVDAAWVAEQPR